jgi:hypothetical protein
VNRRRRELAALVTFVALAAGCGSSDDDAAPAAPAAAATVTVVVSDWTAGDCDPAGRHEGAIYRVCYSSPGERGLDVLSGGDVEAVPVEDPPGAKVGHWRWAALSPDGETFVATWSAECEIPIAFTFPARGGRPEPVTDEQDWTEAPESEALGWTNDGEPIVRLLKGACGKSADEPGTYVYADGDGRRLDHELEPSLEPRDVG